MKFFIIILFLIILFQALISSEIIYTFKRNFELNEKMTEEDIYLKLAYNDIYTSIKLGTPQKEIKVGIKFKDKSLVILGSSIKGREIFDETRSSSYNSIQSIYCVNTPMSEANKSEEYIYLNTINNKEKITFILATELDNENEPIYYSGYLGLSINSEFQSDFPESLPIYLNEKINKKYNSAFAIIFNNNEHGNFNGKLVMNGYPHEYDKNNYNKKQYKTSRIQSTGIYNDWCLSIDNTFYGNTSIIHDHFLIFRIESGIIKAPRKFMDYITKKYFDTYGEKCHYNSSGLMFDDYKYYVCNKDIDITKFENLNFELKAINFNFTLSYKELFFEYNNKYYFLMASSSDSSEHFTIGTILMKKYDFVFDKFNSNIGFYDKSIKVDESNYFIIFIIIISVLVFLIILILIYLVWKYFNKPRNSRKNELNDDYNYISAINADEKEG